MNTFQTQRIAGLGGVDAPRKFIIIDWGSSLLFRKARVLLSIKESCTWHRSCRTAGDGYVSNQVRMFVQMVVWQLVETRHCRWSGDSRSVLAQEDHKCLAPEFLLLVPIATFTHTSVYFSAINLKRSFKPRAEPDDMIVHTSLLCTWLTRAPVVEAI